MFTCCWNPKNSLIFFYVVFYVLKYPILFIFTSHSFPIFSHLIFFFYNMRHVLRQDLTMYPRLAWTSPCSTGWPPQMQTASVSSPCDCRRGYHAQLLCFFVFDVLPLLIFLLFTKALRCRKSFLFLQICGHTHIWGSPYPPVAEHLACNFSVQNKQLGRERSRA